MTLEIHRKTTPRTDGVGVNRRQFLLGTTSTLLLTACGSAADRSVPSIKVAPLDAIRPGNFVIDDLLSTSPFYIAHRGSGDNWVEHTVDAYTRSIEWGSKAIEVSVQATSDGVLICHHDGSTKRMTGTSNTISRTSWETLSRLRNDERAWLGPAAALQPIALLQDVLDAFAETHVLFIEDKQGTNTDEMLSLMDKYSGSTAHLVWKEPANGVLHPEVRVRGYKTWGYFVGDSYADALPDKFDYLGVEAAATDQQITRLVSYGKPVIAWPVTTHSIRDRMLKLGVAGMMCSNIPYVTAAQARARSDNFASGLRSPGDRPETNSWVAQPRINAAAASITLTHTTGRRYLMGSLCPVDAPHYRIEFDIRWPDKLPGSNDGAGLAFGAPDDNADRVHKGAQASGYHLAVLPTGTVELVSSPPTAIAGTTAGTIPGTTLGTMATPAPRSGEWLHFQVDVSPSRIQIHRLGFSSGSITTNDAAYRGGYFWLCKNYAGGPGVEFRSVVVSI